MDYDKDILNRLIDIYERRGAFDKDASSLRAIQIDVDKTYPAYGDRYNHDAYKDINTAIEKLSGEGLVIAKKDGTGKFSKVKLNVLMVQECYKKLKRKSIPRQCERVREVLEECPGSDTMLTERLIKDWLKLLKEYKKLPYDLKYDFRRVKEVLSIINAIMKLNKETYIRNFSTALFRDSKRFQREFRPLIESILYDYTDEIVEKDKILEFYNLYENPTYVLIKGNAVIKFDSSVINVKEMPDGIAFSNASLEKIKSIEVNSDKVITVENLTTYHDCDEEDLYIYLGGYHNRLKQILLEKIYNDNKAREYFHMGDLDVYGFLILENLKEKTGIPFKPLGMDIKTIERFYNAGIYRELTASDRKVIEKNKNIKLAHYKDVLQFMLDHNCKVEQESVKAVEILEGSK